MGAQVTLTEAAAFLGVGKSTLRNWDKAGRTPAARSLANGRRTYDMDDLIQLKKEIEAATVLLLFANFIASIITCLSLLLSLYIRDGGSKCRCRVCNADVWYIAPRVL